MQEEDDRRKELILKANQLQNDVFRETEQRNRAVADWNEEKNKVHFEMKKEREAIVEKTVDKKHQIVLMREELARLKRVKAQMLERSEDHRSMIKKAEEEKQAQEVRVKNFIQEMYTMENNKQ